MEPNTVYTAKGWTSEGCAIYSKDDKEPFCTLVAKVSTEVPESEMIGVIELLRAAPETARERDRFKVALVKIAKLAHPDKTCSLEAQGYDERDCVVIGATDSVAEIAKDALAGVEQDEIFSITGGLARRDKIIAELEIAAKGALSALSQNATFPADVAAAKKWLSNVVQLTDWGT